MIQKVKISRVVIKDKDKDGNPLVTKSGKAYKRVGIQTDKTGDNWWSTNVFREEWSKEIKLKAGDEALVKFDESSGFKNFSIASKSDVLQEEFDALKDRVARIENHLSANGVTSAGTKVPDFKEVDQKNTITADEIDF